MRSPAGPEGAPSPPPTPLRGRVLFLGDSITQAGDYVSLFEYALLRRFPDRDFDLIGVGLSSETVSGLSEPDHPFPRPCLHGRLGSALALARPQTVVACYGMNDGIYHPPDAARERAFRDGINRLIAAVRAAGARMILLMTPPPFVSSSAPGTLTVREFSYRAPYQGYNDVLEEYSAWLCTLAAPDITVADVHGALMTFLRHRREADPDFSLSPDGIHPSPLGHLLIMQTLWSALGLTPWDTAPETLLELWRQDPLYTRVEERRRLRSAAWLSYIGYAREETVKTDDIRETEAHAARLQSRIDRLRRGH